MATAKRPNTPARWVVLVGTGLAAAGFWAGVINGPPPAQAGPQMVTASQFPAQAPNRSAINRSGRFSAPSLPRVQAPVPRFRTRGS